MKRPALSRLAWLIAAVASLAALCCAAVRSTPVGASPLDVRLLREPDDRAAPRGAEIRDGRASGYVHLSRSPAAFIGSAFVAYSPASLLSAAHVFSDGTEWRRELRGAAGGGPDFSKLRVFLDSCGRSYDIKAVHLYRQGPIRWESDVALVILGESVCAEAQGAAVRTLAPADIDRLIAQGDGSISLHAYQRLTPTAARFDKLVSYGRALRRLPEAGGNNLLAVSTSTLRGASGGMLVSYETGRAAAFGMMVAEPEDIAMPFNIAIALDHPLESWARRILAQDSAR
ncbi:MAG: hypothetical protein FJX20_12985 [Alphaproteobacteria bacterium]|nr:hypothetical protein [Alphaproteobacteria bacterium]